MIKLINGRGQLGEALKNKIANVKVNEDIYIYHTWNIDDKSKQTQEKEYQKFIHFVKKNTNKKIVFISTSLQKDNWYTYFKQLAEAFLLMNNKNPVIIRFPSLIGKGIYSAFKKSNLSPYGSIQLMSIKEAVNIILEKSLRNDKIKNHHISGETVSAKNIQQLILFGKNS